MPVLFYILGAILTAPRLLLSKRAGAFQCSWWEFSPSQRSIVADLVLWLEAKRSTVFDSSETCARNLVSVFLVRPKVPLSFCRWLILCLASFAISNRNQLGYFTFGISWIEYL
jgi:hypothetical protein